MRKSFHTERDLLGDGAMADDARVPRTERGELDVAEVQELQKDHEATFRHRPPALDVQEIGELREIGELLQLPVPAVMPATYLCSESTCIIIAQWLVGIGAFSADLAVVSGSFVNRFSYTYRRAFLAERLLSWS